MEGATIGQAAARVGLKVPTVRYYERIALLPAPPRTDGDRRVYDEVAIQRLAFVKHARDLGFSISAIRSLLDLARDPEQPCADANVIVAEQLSEVERKIGQLTVLRSRLAEIGSACAGGRVADCRVIESLDAAAVGCIHSASG